MRETKRRKKTRVRVRAPGDKNCRDGERTAKEGGEVDEKECEERNVGGFQRRTRGTVASARRDVSKLSVSFLARIQSD